MTVTSRNALVDVWDLLPAVAARLAAPGADGAFAPGWAVPELDDAVRDYLSVATMGWHTLGTVRDSPVTLLDLTANPGTRTTKTFASLLIVARAVQHVRRTGERIVIFSPTSANKGTALRDAVGRALAAGLVTPDELRVVVLAPAANRDKLRAGGLAAEEGLRRRNPLLLHPGPRGEDVKDLGRAYARDHAADLHRRTGTRVWFSLELGNYLYADAARAFVEQELSPTGSAGRPRVHAHAVSSAYGLLGYSVGRDLLEERGTATAGDRPGYLLVQHLGTPDMVLSLHHGTVDRSAMPAYRFSAGLYRQDTDPRFPAMTYDPEEILDPTFYTHSPATSPAMNALVARFGGGGIVVSLAECLQRWPELLALTAGVPRPLPRDPRVLREWSLAMALTGTSLAVERGLVPAGAEVVVHGSGWYGTDEADPPGPADTVTVGSVEEIAAAVLAGA